MEVIIMRERDRFSISIKGVVKNNDSYLLRKNERTEYELLGGRLEKDDISPQERLTIEFKEESGIDVSVGTFREPWLYEIGYSNIIIVPYLCQALTIPEVLYDEDGGELEWIKDSEINSIFMPQGYKDTILEKIPHKSYSIPAKKFFKIIPNYVERNYYVDVRVFKGNDVFWQGELVHFNTPRDLIYKNLGEEFKDCVLQAQEITINREQDTIILNYTIL